MAKQTTQFDPTKTIRLAELRDTAGVTQQEAADFFYLKDRASVRAWEFGYSSPPAKHRQRLIVYLLDKLALRKEPERFRRLWDELMVNTWEWQPLSADEWLHYLPHTRYSTGQAIGIEPLAPAVFFAPPRPPYPLVGRQTTLQMIQQRLFTLRDTVLCGLPGVGKTALAIEVANDRTVLQHFRDGVLWARLGRAGDLFTELGKWAQALGVASSELATLTTVEERAEIVHQRIGLQRMLLVIDDIWQIEAALGFQVGGLNCARLMTTRFPALAVQLGEEQTIAIPELAEEDGLLLLQRLALTKNIKDAELARRLVKAVGSLPLALILLGNYVRTTLAHQPQWQLEQLGDQLTQAHTRLALAEAQSPLLRHPSLPRGAKISLQAVIEISFQALAAIDQRTLRALALFPAKPNTFALPAALAVVARNDNILEPLIDAGLVEVNQERYTLHQTIADYANLQPFDLAAAERMVAYFVDTLALAPNEHTSTELEFSNILQALQFAQDHLWSDRFVQGVNLLYWFAEARGLYEMFAPWLQRAVTVAQRVNNLEGLVNALFNLSLFASQRGELAEAEAILQGVTPLVEQLQQPAISIRHLRQLGRMAVRRRAYAQAEDYWQQALTLAQATDNIALTTILYSNLGGVSAEQGYFDAAYNYYLDGLPIARSYALPEELCGLLINLTNLLIRLDRYEEADLYLQEGLQIARQVHHRLLLYHLLECQGAVAALRQDYALASSSFQETLTLAEELHDPNSICSTHQQLASLAITLGHSTKFEYHLRFAFNLAEQSGDRYRLSMLSNIEGKFYLDQQQWAKALPAYEKGLYHARAIGAQPDEADALFGLAQALFELGKVGEAIAHAQASLTILLPYENNETREVQCWLASRP